MDISAYHEDIEYLYNKLLSHPLLIIDKSKKDEFDSLFHRLADQVTCYCEFITSINQLTCFFHDGHTNIEIPYSEADKAINIPCGWNHEKLVLSKDYMEIPKGSQIICIENIPISEVITGMANRIPHENIFLVKSRMVNYPYKNYHVFSEDNLKTLFGCKHSFEFSFLTDGQVVQKVIQLKPYDGHLDFVQERFVSYEIADNVAVLHLDACIYNDEYKNALDELVELCDEKGITTLVLDLSRNMGGSSAVIDEFIKHTRVKQYRRYEMIDYSQGMAVPITSRTEWVKNVPYPKCFECEIYCHVSHDTFSSARTFAVILKDNGIASKIIGMPTGGKPNSFGMPQRFTTPNCFISFRVSQCSFLRPNEAGDDDISLYPDEV